MSSTPTPQKSVQHRICTSMLHNSGMFLRRAAEEIAGHEEFGDRPFHADRATFVTVLIQTAVELAAVAFVIEEDGLASVMRKGAPQTEEEAERRWRTGEIATRSFEDLKGRAAQLFGEPDFWSLVDAFQLVRNKLVHFHLPFEHGDLVDIKYEATHILLQLVNTLSRADRLELPDGGSSFLGADLFKKLIGFGPYRNRVEAVAREIDGEVFRCIFCDMRTYSDDCEKCLGCGYTGDLRFLWCPSCDKRAVYHDHANLPLNDTLPALCGACGWKGEAAHCSRCNADFIIAEGQQIECPNEDRHRSSRLPI